MTVTSKPARFNFHILATALILFGTVACSTQASPSPNTDSSGEKAIAPAKVKDPTTFSCVQQGGWATFTKRGTRISESPLITWNTTEFGSEFTSEKRCQIVSQKLTEVVAKNGGLLRKLQLTTGLVNGLTVVCVITPPEQKSCNRNNQLFTLSKENAKNPRQVLVNIANFSTGKADSKSTPEKDPPAEISLETLVNCLLPQDSGL